MIQNAKSKICDQLTLLTACERRKSWEQEHDQHRTSTFHLYNVELDNLDTLRNTKGKSCGGGDSDIETETEAPTSGASISRSKMEAILTSTKDKGNSYKSIAVSSPYINSM